MLGETADFEYDRNLSEQQVINLEFSSNPVINSARGRKSRDFYDTKGFFHLHTRFHTFVFPPKLKALYDKSEYKEDIERAAFFVSCPNVLIEPYQKRVRTMDRIESYFLSQCYNQRIPMLHLSYKGKFDVLRELRTVYPYFEGVGYFPIEKRYFILARNTSETKATVFYDDSFAIYPANVSMPYGFKNPTARNCWYISMQALTEYRRENVLDREKINIGRLKRKYFDIYNRLCPQYLD